MNLLFLIFVTCLLLLGVGVLFYSWHKKKLVSSAPSIPSDKTDNPNNNLSVEEDGEFLELLPKVITLSNNEVLDFEKMHEIKDRGVLAKVNAIIPQFANNVYDSINKRNFRISMNYYIMIIYIRLLFHPVQNFTRQKIK